MVLSMARPWKHPKSGVYWFRKRVPDRLRAQVGKIEEKFSLGTTDPGVARVLHAAALAQVEQRWANLLVPQRTPTMDEARDMAEPVYRRIVEEFTNNPLKAKRWDVGLGNALLDNELLPDDRSLGRALVEGSFALKDQMNQQCWDEVTDILKSKGLDISLEGRCILHRAVIKATQAAFISLRESDRNPYQFQPQVVRVNDAVVSTVEVTFELLLEGWQLEKRPSKKTVYTWERIVAAFMEFLHHGNANLVTADDIVGWKNALLAAGLSSKTVQFGKLAAVRALLQWGVDNRKLPSNVAAGVKAGGNLKIAKTKRSFSEGEAKVVLIASRAQEAAHLRWIPWICAFTGARLSEVCQLRKNDVEEVDGIWVLKILADAGSLKNTNSERVVPIHSELVTEGFIAFVRGAPVGPLFPELTPDRFGSRGGNGTKLIGRWVRGLGLKDERISPSHSWRHRFKTLARRHGLALDVVNAITGHGRKDVADAYGEYPLEALSNEIEKLPQLRF